MMRSCSVVVLAAVLMQFSGTAAASQQSASPEPPAANETPASSKPSGATSSSSTPAESRRSDLNLLGNTDSERGESRRNENVQFNLIDNNVLKEMNVRLGATATIVQNFKIEQRYFGAEFGAPSAGEIHAKSSAASGVHGNLFWLHSNSVFSARAFFQVGPVRPAHENNFGGRFSAPLWKGAALTLNGVRNNVRGNVNGNVLIPLASERMPLTSDPELAAIVRTYLAAFPNEAPNRPDIAARAHNTNSLQRIDTDTLSGQIDQRIRTRDSLVLAYSLTGQGVDAFQFVTGQNPDTDTKNHRARATWNRAWSPATLTSFTLGFDRLTNLLLPASGAIGPINFSMALTSLGPSPPIPIDRVQNRYQGAGQIARSGVRHTVTGGFSFVRLQYNGEETDAHRGIVNFGNDFGRDAITNLRMGTPSSYDLAVGSVYRGYRNWNGALYLGDIWRASARLTINAGVRYEPSTRPVDVTGRSDLPFGSDLNNWGPRFGLAWRAPGRWGVLRAAYALLYGEIFPTTYGHERFNPPHSIRIFVPAPDLKDPLQGIDLGNLDPNTPATRVEVSPDLSTPYSHQYNFSWELSLARDWNLQLGYVGGRSHRLLLTYFQNRARPVDGIPLISATINQRRPDATKNERLIIHNGSRGWYDAGRASLIAPRWRGFTLNASYWFSKAFDLGGNYTNTASPPDARTAVSQFEDVSQPDLKALSTFDQPHSFLAQASWQVPRMERAGRMARETLGSWNVSVVGLLKTGTPFTVLAGSDAPDFGNVDGSRWDRPMILDPAILGRTVGNPDVSRQLIPRSAFRFFRAPAEMWGNLGRSTFRKGRIANLNVALWKDWALDRRWRLTLRTEAINLTNTPQFAEPGVELANPNFGQINNTLNDGRAFRFQFQLNF